MQFRVDTDGMTFIVGGIRGVMDFETKIPVLDKSSGAPLFDVDVMAVVAGERPVNRPGFDAYLPGWEGWRHAKQVRRGYEGPGCSSGS